MTLKFILQQFLLATSFLAKKFQWTGGDLNPGPRRCQRRDHSRLIYPPKPIPNKKAIKHFAEYL